MTINMDANTFALYIHELRNQCMYAETALNLFNQSLEKQSKGGVFFAAQSFLTAAQQISRLLWPNRAKAKRRGEFLRQALGIPQEFPLSDDRLRNLWDLADEKTDDWINGSKNQVIAYDFLGPIGALGEKLPKDEHIYRLYDPETNRFYYRGDVFNLQQLAQQIAAVSGRVNGAHDQLFPKQPPAEAEATPDTAPEAISETIPEQVEA
ncbi:hypothetical protein [Govanella unica]|uniref:Uncharacterized protein n=1 Tax=Govanella unica TaxID=2975056 RepID=A0A9X3Z8A9_9PROT|nr:hypothetical protein [Govania unica]MDA5194956.1 hypothetical protein [Govania unica]